MKRTYSPVLVLLSLSAFLGLVSAQDRGQDGSKEPPLEFVLAVGEKERPIILGQAQEFVIAGKKVKLTLKVKETRLFRRPGCFRFRYPKDYLFESDFSTPGVRSWTLEHNDVVLMLHETALEPKAATFLSDMTASILEAYKKHKPKASEVTLNLGGKILQGKRIDVSILGSHLRQEIFAFRCQGQTYGLVLQDSPRADGTSTRELVELCKRLKESFQFIKEK